MTVLVGPISGATCPSRTVVNLYKDVLRYGSNDETLGENRAVLSEQEQVNPRQLHVG
jgi:hypothetical protein